MLVIASDHHQLHRTDSVKIAGHPTTPTEVPARGEILLRAVEQQAWCRIRPPADHGRAVIEAVHSEDYLAFLQEASRVGEELEALIHPTVFSPRQAVRVPDCLPGLVGRFSFGAYTPILKGTWEAAYWSAQCAVTGAVELASGASRVYSLCRPPGHHAAADLFGGYCYLNNAAIAARELQRLRSGARVSILDIDYHHGNGTQLIFYTDPSVQFCSLHAHPDDDYPYYWGDSDECGQGPGEGTNHNWPLPPKTPDEGYLTALREALHSIEEYAPDFLIVSAGLDIVKGDPEGGFEVSRSGLGQIGRAIADLGLQTLVIQEGGYLLDRLGEDLVALLQGMEGS